jgi:hypothetical protein
MFTKEVEKNSTEGRPDDTRVKSEAYRGLKESADAQSGNAGDPRRNGRLLRQKSLVVRQKLFNTRVVRIISRSKSLARSKGPSFHVNYAFKTRSKVSNQPVIYLFISFFCQLQTLLFTHTRTHARTSKNLPNKLKRENTKRKEILEILTLEKRVEKESIFFYLTSTNKLWW